MDQHFFLTTSLALCPSHLVSLSSPAPAKSCVLHANHFLPALQILLNLSITLLSGLSNLPNALQTFCLLLTIRDSKENGVATVFPSQISFFEAKIKGRGRVARPPGHTQGSLGRPRRRGRNQDYDKRPRSGFSLSTTLISHPTITHPSQPCTSSKHTEIHPWSPIQENHPQNFITPTPTLFSPFYSSQERWPERLHHRPFIPQYPFDNTYLQNGTCLPNSLLHSRTDVGLHSGPTGRFLPCSCGLVFPHFPCIRGGRPDLCFPSPPIWSVDRPLGIFQGDEARQGIHPQDPNQFPYLSGRFPHSSGFQGISGFSHPIHSFSPPTAGSPYKLQEVTPHSFSDHRVPRGHFPSRHPSPFSPCLKGTKDHLSLPKHSP